jgi:hypothetical protein
MILMASLKSAYFAVKQELEEKTDSSAKTFGPISDRGNSLLDDYGFESITTGNETLLFGSYHSDA